MRSLRWSLWGILFGTFFAISLYGFEKGISPSPSVEVEKKKENWVDEKIETVHSIQLKGREIAYKAICGMMILRDEKGQPKAKMFYTSYMKQQEEGVSKRPITFFFNGGPGASSVWLHLGAFGPQRLALNPEGYPLTPYRVEPNENTLLEETDLVFVDPISTGYSRLYNPEDGKLFYGYEEDIKAVGEFIRLYVTQNNRWTSPKFLVGESYGTTRIAGLSLHLHDQFNMPLNGLVMISAALNFQAFDAKPGNDLPYVNLLPSYTAAAWFYKKLPPDLQADRQKAIQESQAFASTDYLIALQKGDLLTEQERTELAQKLARYTRLPPDYIQNANFRVRVPQFTQRLLKEEGRVIGRFDARYQGFALNNTSDFCFYDPSMERVILAFTSAFNAYARTDLQWVSNDEYRVLYDLSSWTFSKGNEYLMVTDELREVFIKNPSLQLFVAGGAYDLATPFTSVQYALNHMALPSALKGRVKMEVYEAGHMMFLQQEVLHKLKQDVANFIQIDQTRGTSEDASLTSF